MPFGKHPWCLLIAGVLMTSGCSSQQSAPLAPLVLTVLNEQADRQDAPENLSRDAALNEPVIRVATRLIAAARRSGYGPAAGALSWKVAVIDNDRVRQAVVLPDGDIIVYSGLFHLARTEAGLAAILGHEVVHALAHYGDDKLSRTLSRREPLLFTRAEELEADEGGLKLMAEAGYDPWEMFLLWKRMKQMSAEASTADPVLIHLAYDRRMVLLDAQLPEARLLYERARRAPQRALPPR